MIRICTILQKRETDLQASRTDERNPHRPTRTDPTHQHVRHPLSTTTPCGPSYPLPAHSKDSDQTCRTSSTKDLYTHFHPSLHSKTPLSRHSPTRVPQYSKFLHNHQRTNLQSMLLRHHTKKHKMANGAPIDGGG